MTDGDLDSIIRRHIDQTLEMFRRDGTMHTHALVVGYDGRIVGLSAMLLHDFAAFNHATRELSEHLEAVAIVTVSESWMSETPRGDWPTHSPGEDPERQETLLVQVETWNRTRVHLWRILRDSCGVSLGDEMDGPDDCVSRFASYLRRPQHN